MNRRLAAALFAFVLPPVALATTGAAAAPTWPPRPPRAPRPARSPAEFFPAHTYLYMQLDPFATVRGFKTLRLTRLLQDPTLRGLFDQALRSIPAQADPRKMLERYPFDKAVGEQVGIGVTGFRGRFRATEHIPSHTLLYPEEGALPPDAFRRSVNIQGRSLLALEIRDEALFMKTLRQLLADTLFDGEPPEPTPVVAGDYTVQGWTLPNVGKLYTRFQGGYFLLAQSAEDLVTAIELQSRRAAALDSRADFRRFRQHRGSKPTAGFLHIGVDSAIELFGPLIPAADREVIGQWGGFDVSGVQIGMGFHDGGICEWLHIALAENPHGLLLNLARLWPSTGFVEKETYRGTVYAASLTFDWTALFNATTTILELCDVDTKAFQRQTSADLGMDLRDDLMGALGTTMGAVAVMPKRGIIPELSLVFKVRNRARMEKVLARVEAICQHEGLPIKKFTVSGDGPKATYVTLSKDVPVKPAWVLRGDKLVVSVMPLMLKYAVRNSRHDRVAIVEHIPDATSAEHAARFSWFVDPAPMTESMYTDLLKLLDSSGQRLPFDITDLPEPEFVASALSRFGIEGSIDCYYMALDLHSPTGLVLPLVVGAAIAAQQEQATHHGSVRGRSGRPRSDNRD